MLIGHKNKGVEEGVVKKINGIFGGNVLEIFKLNKDEMVVNFRVNQQRFAIYFLIQDVKTLVHTPYHIVMVKRNVSKQEIEREDEDKRSCIFMQKLMKERIDVIHLVSLDELPFKIAEMLERNSK